MGMGADGVAAVGVVAEGVAEVGVAGRWWARSDVVNTAAVADAEVGVAEMVTTTVGVAAVGTEEASVARVGGSGGYGSGACDSGGHVRRVRKCSVALECCILYDCGSSGCSIEGRVRTAVDVAAADVMRCFERTTNATPTPLFHNKCGTLARQPNLCEVQDHKDACNMSGYA